MREDGNEGDQAAMDGLRGEVKDGVEATRLRGIFRQLEGSGGVDVAIGQPGQLNWKSSTVLQLAFFIRRGDVDLQFVDVSLQIAVDVFEWAGDRREFCRSVVADHFQDADKKIAQHVAELVERFEKVGIRPVQIVAEG